MNDLTINASISAPLPSSPFLGRHFINNEWHDSSDGRTFERVSPSHGLVVSRCALGGAKEAEAGILAARSAFDSGVWSSLSGKERAAVLSRVADLIEANVDQMALLETLESGKPISQSKAEVSGAPELWRQAAALARTSYGDSHNSLGSDMVAMVLKEPIGVVSIITPWNFPFWILSQKLPFALGAGCCCVVKPSEMTSSTTIMLGTLLQEAGMPPGVCNILLGYGDPVGSTLSAHDAVDMVSFTGSTAVGKRISEAASASLKKVALELGGKNAMVVCPDADLDSAADAAVFGAYFNGGQCCNASSRILVHTDISDSFTQKLVALSSKVRFGDPLDPTTQVGAIVTADHNQKIDQCVRAAEAEGAQIALGGGRLSVEGLGDQFYQPTILTNLSSDMAVARDEVFGPVLSVLTFESLDHAISIVNDSDYGLSAGIWSESVHTCLDFSRRAQAGTIWTNTWMDGFPELAFGGMKQSGQGREVGQYGFDEFLEVKSVVMRVGQTRDNWVSRG